MIETASIFHVECPSCHTSFPVDPSKVPEGGVLARCSKCPAIFPVRAPEDLPLAGGPSNETSASTPEAPSVPGHEPFSLDGLDQPAAPMTEEGFGQPGAETLDTILPEPTPEPEPAVPAFGKRDPDVKARRLARVLVSDMITYNRERHARALANGTLAEDFEDEIKKSWSEYVDQVGQEMADGTSYFAEALNEILAQGRQLF